MGHVVDAAKTFFDHLADVGWQALGIALGCHFLRLLVRTPAWRNIIRAAYPDQRIPWRPVIGGYLAGVGVNSILPARGGDALKLYLVKHRTEGTTYPTLTATLIVETLFDSAVAAVILLWALVIGVLPGTDVLPSLPQVDWSWPVRHPKPAIVIGLVWLAVLVALWIVAVQRVRDFRQRVRQGFAILGDRRRFLRQVLTWQALSWAFRAASIFFFLQAFHVPATARNVMLVLAVQSLATLLPFTPGGIGTQQGLLVYVFRRDKTGIADVRVVSFSVGMQIATTALNVLVGFTAIFLMLGTLRWRRVVTPEEEEPSYARPT